MLRKITKTFGRYKPGEHHDYPVTVWRRLSEESGMKLDDFSVQVDNPLLMNNLKRKPTLRTRLGATQ